LQHEGHRSASTAALSRQAKRTAAKRGKLARSNEGCPHEKSAFLMWKADSTLSGHPIERSKSARRSDFKCDCILQQPPMSGSMS
jgi:hypothetical protein